MNHEPTAEEIADALAANPMRMLSRLRCLRCGHAWQQPKPSGRCPRCQSARTQCVDQRPCMIPRA